MVPALTESRSRRNEPRPRCVLGPRTSHEADHRCDRRGGPGRRGGARPRMRSANRRRERGLLAPGSRSRMDAEPRCHGEALEDRRSVSGARDPPEREGGEGPRCASPGDRESPRLSGRCTGSSEGPRDPVRLEAAARSESDQAGSHRGRREAVPQPVLTRVAACDSASVE